MCVASSQCPQAEALTLDGRAAGQLSGKMSFAQPTTRQHYRGMDCIEFRINGVGYPLGKADVRTATR